VSFIGRFRADACPSACPLCDALRARHLPVGLCGQCDHIGGIRVDGRVYVLMPHHVCNETCRCLETGRHAVRDGPGEAGIIPAAG